jgi:hypothetical protein
MPASKPIGSLTKINGVTLVTVASEDERCARCYFGPESCDRDTVCSGLGRDDDQMVEVRIYDPSKPPGTVFPWVDKGETITLEAVESTPGLLCQECHFNVDNVKCKSNHPVCSRPDYDVYFVKI